MKNAVISYIFRFNYLAALAIMSVCPLCQNHHPQEVNECQRCTWSMQDDLKSVGIDSDHPIIKTYIPAIVTRLENETKALHSLIKTSNIDIQKANSQKLDEIIDGLEDIKKQQLESIKSISDLSAETNTLTNTTKSVIDSDNKCNKVSKRSINSDSNFKNQSPEDSLYNSASERYPNDNFGSINEPLQGIVDNSLGNCEFYEPINSSKSSELETNSSDNYHNFYLLIEQKKIEVTKVTVTKETMEKMRSGTQSQLEFSNDRRGNYLIINWQDVYCLIPKEKLNINPYQYGNFQRVFNCEDYRETYRDFEVIEPATVISCDRELWQLERKGKIKFI